jgi:hypothetical protein
MRNAFTLSLVAIMLVYFAGCTKCYQCSNACSVCTQKHPDTTFTIRVCSDALGQQYYGEYIDSLNSAALGWICTDTNSTYTQKFCADKANQSGDLANKANAGLICNGN